MASALKYSRLLWESFQGWSARVKYLLEVELKRQGLSYADLAERLPNC